MTKRLRSPTIRPRRAGYADRVGAPEHNGRRPGWITQLGIHPAEQGDATAVRRLQTRGGQRHPRGLDIPLNVTRRNPSHAVDCA